MGSYEAKAPAFFEQPLALNPGSLGQDCFGEVVTKTRPICNLHRDFTSSKNQPLERFDKRSAVLNHPATVPGKNNQASGNTYLFNTSCYKAKVLKLSTGH